LSSCRESQRRLKPVVAATIPTVVTKRHVSSKSTQALLRASRRPLQSARVGEEPVRLNCTPLLSEPAEAQEMSHVLSNRGVMNVPGAAHPKLARRLVLDELFDLSIYRSLRNVASGELREVLDQLIPIELRHFTFWQDFFDVHMLRQRLWPTNATMSISCGGVWTPACS
jgi:hypothetical protein